MYQSVFAFGSFVAAVFLVGAVTDGLFAVKDGARPARTGLDVKETFLPADDIFLDNFLVGVGADSSDSDDFLFANVTWRDDFLVTDSSLSSWIVGRFDKGVLLEVDLRCKPDLPGVDLSSSLLSSSFVDWRDKDGRPSTLSVVSLLSLVCFVNDNLLDSRLTWRNINYVNDIRWK